MDKEKNVKVYHLEIFRDYINLIDFRVKLCALNKGKIALANDKFLIISNGILIDKNIDSRIDDINTVVEFNEVSGKPTCFLWISDIEICIGFESGVIACFDINGNTLFEKSFKKIPVHTLRLSDVEVDVGKEVNVEVSNEGILWILYGKGQLISVRNILGVDVYSYVCIIYV